MSIFVRQFIFENETCYTIPCKSHRVEYPYHQGFFYFILMAPHYYCSTFTTSVIISIIRIKFKNLKNFSSYLAKKFLKLNFKVLKFMDHCVHLSMSTFDLNHHMWIPITSTYSKSIPTLNHHNWITHFVKV